VFLSSRAGEAELEGAKLGLRISVNQLHKVNPEGN